jgi:Zn-finger nucleic acid-binding protein
MTAYRSMQLECPACGGPVDETTIADTNVQVCPRCRGVWVESPTWEIAAVAREVAVVQNEAPPSSRRTSCPRCEEPLAFHSVAGIDFFVHRCSTCRGIFIPPRRAPGS